MPKTILGAGRIISALSVLFLVFDCVGHLVMPAPVVEALARLGYPLSLAVPLGIIELFCLAIYVVPRTSILGSVLLTGYLGGAGHRTYASMILCSMQSSRSFSVSWFGAECSWAMSDCAYW